MSDQRVFIRITIPAIKLADAVKLKEKLDKLLADVPGATCEMSVMTAPTQTAPGGK